MVAVRDQHDDEHHDGDEDDPEPPPCRHPECEPGSGAR
jgi:hypothetical protein